MIFLIYEEKKQEENVFVSVNNLIQPRKEYNSIGAVPPYLTKEQEISESPAQKDDQMQFKKADSGENLLEGIGVNAAKTKTDSNRSPYEEFATELKKRKEEKEQKAKIFWAMRGIEGPPLSKISIGYRDSLAQKAGGSAAAKLQASLVVIGYDLGTYGPEKNGVDGHIGPVTEKAIKEFQKATGLALTGKMDEQTMTALDLVIEAGFQKDDLNIFEQTLNAMFKYNWIGENVTSDFKLKVLDISNKLKMDPDDLMAIMAFESGFSPSIRNKVSGATGLIQFMGSTAKGLGTTTDDLTEMSAVEQLDYVYKYFKPYAGKIHNIQDAYMAVFMPIAVGKSNDFVLGIKESTDKLDGISYGLIYKQNSGLDINRDGKITKEEAASCVVTTRNRYKY